MDMFRFNILPLYEQCTLISQNGSFIASRKFRNNLYGLYAIYDYYAETLSVSSGMKVISVEVFKDIEKLEPYLSRIALPE
jgi:hypothetical protein